MIVILVTLGFGILALSWGIYHLYPTKKDVKGSGSTGVIVSSDKTFEEAHQESVDMLLRGD